MGWLKESFFFFYHLQKKSSQSKESTSNLASSPCKYDSNQSPRKIRVQGNGREPGLESVIFVFIQKTYILKLKVLSLRGSQNARRLRIQLHGDKAEIDVGVCAIVGFRDLPLLFGQNHINLEGKVRAAHDDSPKRFTVFQAKRHGAKVISHPVLQDDLAHIRNLLSIHLDTW